MKFKQPNIKQGLIFAGLVVYLILSILLLAFLPKIMSGGDPAREIVLETGQTYAMSDIDIPLNNSPEKDSLKINDKVYLVSGAGDRVIIQKKKTAGATRGIIMDIADGIARVKVFQATVDNSERFTFGMTFFRIIVAIIVFGFPACLYIYGTKQGNWTFRFDKSGGSKRIAKKYGNQGAAQEGSLKDMKQYVGDDGFTISKNLRLSAKASYEHVLVLGPTGSGKSTSFFIPNLLDLDGKHSAVVTDPKGEMCDLTRNYLESIGYNIVKIKPLQPSENEYRYNPILLTEDEQQMHEIAQIILTNGGKSIEVATGGSQGNIEWVNMSVPLLTAAMFYVRKFGKYKSIPEAIDIIMRCKLDEMEKLFKKDDYAYRQFLAFKASAESEKTMSSIKTVLTTNVQIFFDTAVVEFVTPKVAPDKYEAMSIDYNDLLNPMMLRQKPTVLFICIPENKANYMMPLTSVLYYQLLNIPITHADGCPILFFFDEFPNSGFVLGINTIVSTCRSRRMGLAICSQGVEQLKQVYGEEIASTILNNLKTKLFYAGLTGDSGKYVSDMAGFTTVETKSYSPNSGGTQFLSGLMPHVSKSGTRRELLTTDEIRTMDTEKVLIISQNVNPVFDQKNTYYTQKKYIEKTSKK